MPALTRRELLRSGAALSASSLAAGPFVTRANALLAAYPEAASAEALAAIAPREHLLLDFGWKFQFGHGSDPARDLGLGSSQSDFAKTGFAVPLGHNPRGTAEKAGHDCGLALKPRVAKWLAL